MINTKNRTQISSFIGHSKRIPCWHLCLAPTGITRTRIFSVDCGRYRQSGPRPEPRLLCQAALEALTNSARTDSPHRIGRNEFRRRTAAAAQGGGGGVCCQRQRFDKLERRRGKHCFVSAEEDFSRLFVEVVQQLLSLFVEESYTTAFDLVGTTAYCLRVFSRSFISADALHVVVQQMYFEDS
ncbi:hypothetical protein F511_43128 [Dorcoceras hygrometricum]|uniref:Uncharacterized protein n=1 Tax=Dorcoceras hygrometricum TaxID=472368 RepID=A0A2Z7A2U6_9LAMI|nr:hypothetical protein F511_43128 [Dorcoceras hygrometricum]